MEKDLMKKLNEDRMEGLKTHNDLLRSVSGMLLSRIQKEEIRLQKPLTNKELVLQVRKEAKENDESLAEFIKAGREDLITKHTNIKDVLDGYLSEFAVELATEDEILSLLEEKGFVKGDAPAKMGLMMKELKAEHGDKFNGKLSKDVILGNFK